MLCLVTVVDLTCRKIQGNNQCRCSNGFYGNDITICIDKDECAIGTHDCDSNATCNNTIGGFNCTCRPGFHGNGKKCLKVTESLMECRGGMNCVCEENTCYCEKGFNVASENGTCKDVDECVEGTSRCSHICLNNNGSYSCTCQPGYYLAADKVTCLDIDECELGLHDCDVMNANCSNNNGSFGCSCHQGYHGDGRNCFAANMCKTDSCICPPNTSPYQCVCKPGYLFHLDRDGVSCSDLDECSTDLHNCHHPNGECENTNGSFMCSCGRGFYGNGVVCIDIDECSVGLDNCGNNYNCTNTIGSFNCTCIDGFFPSSNGQCIEGRLPDIKTRPVVRPISELVYDIGNDFCLEDSDITSMTAVFNCVSSGEIIPPPTTTWFITYEFENNQLIEFESNSTNENLTVNLTEFSTPWQRIRITCIKKNRIDSHTVTSIISNCNDSQCQDGITNNCTHGCVRNNTEYKCLCNNGYSLSSDSVSCDDIDECETASEHNCSLDSTTCNNVAGSFSCDCLEGYTETNPPSNICNDKDECSLYHNCTSNQDCVNTNGSYLCICKYGFKKIPPDDECEDQNECMLGLHNCSASEMCANTYGGFNCTCKEGYTRNQTNQECEDINECRLGGVKLCSHMCNNTNGSFTCSCPRGYTLSSDDRTCLELYLLTLIVPIMICIVATVALAWIIRKKKIKLQNCIKRTEVIQKSTEPSSISQVPSRRMDSIELEDLRGKTAVFRPFFESNIIIPGRHIQLINLIGQGQYGLVYRSHLTGWQGRRTAEVVAIKTLKNVFTPDDIKDLMAESEKMMWFNHPNVMSLIGVCIDVGEVPYIVMPFMGNGSLLVYLKKKRSCLTISEEAEREMINDAQRKLLSICIQIAKGMRYLSAQKFIHRDLAARNCMIDDRLVIKVGDFGLSEDIYSRNYFRHGQEEEKSSLKFPIKWMALESLLDGTFSEKTDVWSYGVTCWEIFTLGHTPYPGIHPSALVGLLKSGERLQRPSNASCTHQVFDLITRCWSTSPKERPSFEKLVLEIDTLLENVAGYIDFSEFCGDNQTQ